MAAPNSAHETFPLREFLDFDLDLDGERGVATLTIDDRHLNPHGNWHGGVPFTVMDTVMGATVMNVLPDGHVCATIEMQTRFHRGVRAGTITATAQILSRGRRVVHLSAATVDAEGQLLASATASFAVMEPRSTAMPADD